jgi:hypothetical protein
LRSGGKLSASLNRDQRRQQDRRHLHEGASVTERPGLLTAVAQWWIGRSFARQQSRLERQQASRIRELEGTIARLHSEADAAESAHQVEIGNQIDRHESDRRAMQSRLHQTEADLALAKHEVEAISTLNARILSRSMAVTAAERSDPEIADAALRRSESRYGGIGVMED